MNLPILDTYTSCHVAKILQTERSISLLYVLAKRQSAALQVQAADPSPVFEFWQSRDLLPRPWETRGYNCPAP